MSISIYVYLCIYIYIYIHAICNRSHTFRLCARQWAVASGASCADQACLVLVSIYICIYIYMYIHMSLYFYIHTYVFIHIYMSCVIYYIYMAMCSIMGCRKQYILHRPSSSTPCEYISIYVIIYIYIHTCVLVHIYVIFNISHI